MASLRTLSSTVFCLAALTLSPLATAQKRPRVQPPTTKVFLAGTYVSTDTNGGVTVASDQFVAQQFTLPTAAYAFRAMLILDDTEGQSFLVQLTNQIGADATQANVLAQEEFQGGSTSSGVRYFLPIDLVLPAGTYYLVISASGSNNIGQPVFGGFGLPPYAVLPGTLGTTLPNTYVAYGGSENDAFPPASGFTIQYNVPIEYQVYGETQ